MPSQRMVQLGVAWAAERKRKGLSKVVAGLPTGQRAVDSRFLEREAFVGKDGELSAHLVQQLAQTGAADLIRRLLALKIDADTPDRSGRRATHLAAARGQGIALQELLRHDADVNAQDRLGKTPLHMAVEAGNSLMVKELVLANAGLELRDRAGRSPLLLAILLDKKSKQTPGLHTQNVVSYLTAVGAVLGTADRDGRNAYHYAVQAGDLEMLAGLCAEASASSAAAAAPARPAATSRPAAESVAALAAVKAVNARDAQGLAPLALAASRGHAEAAAMLLDAQADLHTAAANGMQPLHWAIARMSMPTCRLLLGRKADLHQVTAAPPAGDQLSPLGLAARCGFAPMVSHLLQEAQVPFEYGVPRARSGVDPADVLAVLQHAPPDVVNRFQAAQAVHARKVEARRRAPVEEQLNRPVLFDGRRLARGKAGVSLADHATHTATSRQRLRQARAAALLKSADRHAPAGQAESVEAFVERQRRPAEEIEDEQFETWQESLPPREFEGAVAPPDFAEAHKEAADSLAEFVAERRRRIGGDDDPDADLVRAPSFLDPDSERGRQRQELREAYRARLLATLDADTARFYHQVQGDLGGGGVGGASSR